MHLYMPIPLEPMPWFLSLEFAYLIVFQDAWILGSLEDGLNALLNIEVSA